MPGIIPFIFTEFELSGVGGGWTDLSVDVILEEALTWRRGINGGGPNDHVASTGLGSLTLRNDAQNSAKLLGRYSLHHANKLAGWGIGIGCRIRFRDDTTGTIYTQFIGRVDSIDPSFGRFGERRVRVTFVDWMDEAARWKITPEVGEQIERRGDQVLTAIIAEMPTQPPSQSFDAGSDVYAVALDTSANTTALEEFGKLANSEYAFIYEKRDGTFRYEGRHVRMLSAASVWTIGDADIKGMTVPSKRDDVINTFRIIIHPKIVDPDPTTIVYSQANVIEIEPGITKMLLGEFRDQVTGDPIGATAVQPPEPYTDYLASRDGPDGADRTTYMDQSFGLVVGQSGARFLASHSHVTTLFLTKLHLRGRGIKDRGSAPIVATDAASIVLYGEHVVDYDMPYQSSDDVGRGAAAYLLAKYKDTFAQVRTVTIQAETSAQFLHILQRDISDRLTISETLTGVNAAFFINGVEIRISSEHYIEATYTLAPAADPFSGLYWVLDTSTLGTDTLLAPF